MKIITEPEIVALSHQQILIKTNMKRYAWCAVKKGEKFNNVLCLLELTMVHYNSHLEHKLVNVEISDHT